MKSPSFLIRYLRIARPVIIGFALSVFPGCRPSPLPRTSGEMPHDVYVWQRACSSEVATAIEGARSTLREFAPLGAEVVFPAHGGMKVVRPPIDFDPLTRVSQRALVLRIGPFSGPFVAGDQRCEELASLAADLVQTAQRHDAPLSELQIDFDCPSSKLDGYRVWLRAIRKAVAPLQVCITTLPSWLKRPGFEPLIRDAGSYVLQVHSVELPQRGKPPRLYDPDRAKRWVEEAARFGVPFRVALPTYTSEVAFDTSGKVAGVASEGVAPTWPAGLEVRSLRSEAPELARLVRGWHTDRPAPLTGVIWFRLPMEKDRMNWRWPTFVAVIKGREPKRLVRVETKSQDGTLHDLSLVNDGESEEPVPAEIRLRWNHAQMSAADALHGFSLETNPREVRFHPKRSVRIRSGERRAIGWVRLDSKDEIYVEE